MKSAAHRHANETLVHQLLLRTQHRVPRHPELLVGLHEGQVNITVVQAVELPTGVFGFNRAV